MTFPSIGRRLFFSFLVLMVAGLSQGYLALERSARAEGASAPGGVSPNLSLWLKADSGGAGWTDQSGSGVTVAAVGDPALISNSINFNDSLDFDGDDYYDLSAASFPANRTEPRAFYVVARPDNFATHHWAFGYGPRNGGPSQGQNFGSVANNRFLWHSAISIDTYSVQTPWTTTLPIIATFDYDGSTPALFADGSGLTLAANNTPSWATTIDGTLGRVGRFSSDGFPEFWDGEIAEVIVYNDSHSLTERNQIESYLAVKYGITLGTSAAASNYLASDGTVLWDGATMPAYQHDVAGIGRDDASALDQPRSRSINPGALVTLDNGGSFGTDRSFLLWGDNGATTAYTVTAGSNVHMGRIWRTREMGTVGTVTLSVPSSTAAVNLLVDNDTNFSDATVIPLTASKGSLSALVDFTDGQYFTFGQVGGPTNAPGGVSPNLSLWLKANAGPFVGKGAPPTDGNPVTGWTDASPNAHTALQLTPALQPVFADQQLNFNPVLEFTGDQHLENASLPILNQNDYAMFLVTEQLAASPWAGYLSMNVGGNTGQPGITEISTLSTIGMNAMDQTWPPDYSVPIPAQPFIIHNVSVSGTVEIASSSGDVDSGPYSWTPTGSALGYFVGRHGALATQTLNGRIAEAIVYDSSLTAAERNRVESYLAVKYGITLGTSAAPVDYLSADGTVIWDGVETPEYHHDVAGIGRDDASALDQRRSRSINSGALVTMDNGGAFSADSSFLLWGDNGATTAYTVAAGPHLHMGRIWRSREMGTVGPVTISIPSSTAAISLLSDNDPDFSDATVFPLTDDGAGNLIVSVDFPDGNWMFTFAGAAPTAITLDNLNTPIRTPLAETVALLLVMGLLVCGLIRTRTR